MLLCCFFAAPFVALAQDVLPGSEVRVEKLFDARLAEAQRVQLRPSLPQIDTTRLAQQYEVIPVVSEIAYAPPKIRPLAIKVEAPPAAQKGFARAGVGFAPGWIGDIGYVTRNESIALRGDLHTYGFRATDDTDQRYSEVNALLGGTYYADNGLAIDLDFDFDGQRFRYFGFEEAVNDTSLSLAPELNLQYFSIFGLRAGIRNTMPTDIGVDYYFRAGAHFLADNFLTKERNTLIELGGRKDLNEQWYTEAALEIDLTSFSSTSLEPTLAEQALNNYSFNPTIGAHFDQLGFRLGAKISNGNDVFKFFPNAEVSYGLGGGFVVVAGADGGFRKNNFTRMTRYLPYLISQPDLRNAEEWRLYAGVQGQTAGVNYKATASYSRINNLAIYGQDSLEVYKFSPDFDTANVLGLRIEATMPLASRFNGRLQVDARSFSLNTAENPYLLPSLDAQMQVSYDVIEDKFSTSAILTAQNALPFAGPVIQTDPVTPVEDFTSTLFDLSIHGNYWFGKKVGGFVQFNNLFNNQRRKFPFYPILGTNVMAGLVTRF